MSFEDLLLSRLNNEQYSENTPVVNAVPTRILDNKQRSEIFQGAVDLYKFRVNGGMNYIFAADVALDYIVQYYGFDSIKLLNFPNSTITILREIIITAATWYLPDIKIG